MATSPPISTAIKRARERRRWTQQQLAAALGVNVKTVDNWENGRTSPRSSVGALEEILGIQLGGEAAPALGLAAEFGELDEWEQAVADDPDLPDAEKRELISDSRAARAAYVAARRRRRAAAGGPAGGRSGRGIAAG
jgi:transcriptional regulator with XRE-family HTH domain